MLLRPKSNYYKGYFYYLNKGKINTNIVKPKTTCKPNTTCKPKIKKLTTALKNELNSFNCLILKNLSSSKKKSPLISGKFEPSLQLIKYLELNYKLSSKFTFCKQILSDHSFYVNRYFNPRDYCTIYVNNYGQHSFQARLAKPRKFKFFHNQNLDKKELFSKKILHFKFIVDERKN